MDNDPRPESPDAMLDELRDHPGWTDRDRDAHFDRMVERFPAESLMAAVSRRLDNLGGGDAEAMLRLIEARPRPETLRALAQAIIDQPDLPAHRAWDALAVLDGSGVLGDYPSLIDRWDELNDTLDETGSIEELAEQIEGDPEGIWLALQGLVAVEPDVRLEIVEGLSRLPMGPGLTEFFRLLAYSFDDATRAVALAAMSGTPAETAEHRRAWLDIAAYHTDETAIATARAQVDPAGTAGLPARMIAPRLDSSVVSAIDGRGRGTIALSAVIDGHRTTAAFRCDLQEGVIEIGGDIAPDSPGLRGAFEAMIEGIEHVVVSGSPALAISLLAGSLWLSGTSTPPSWRFWVEKTAGPIRPHPFRAELAGMSAEDLTPAETAERSQAVLGACLDWLDDSPQTYEIAEEILLREGESPPDPRRDSGAYRFLFEHRLRDRLEIYRRMLLWMAQFWRAAGDLDLSRSALELASQLSDAQHVVPGHPFAVLLTTRSLVEAQENLRNGRDPRRG